MWTHVHLECHIVWDDVLWSVTATWQEELGTTPVVLEKRGRAPADPERGPDGALEAAVRALQGVALEGR